MFYSPPATKLDTLGAVRIYSHHFCVSAIQARLKPAVMKFVWGLAEIQQFRRTDRFGRVTLDKTVKAIYAGLDELQSGFRFHITELDNFKKAVRDHGLSEQHIEWHTVPLPEFPRVEHHIRPEYVPRDYQLECRDYLAKPLPKMKLVPARTGSGKSFMAMLGVQKIAHAVGVIVKAAYLDKWVEDLERTLYVEKGDVEVIRGSDALMSLLEEARAHGAVKAKWVLVSINTFAKWVKDYEKHGREYLEQLGYPCAPYEFFEFCGLGIKLVDEVHEHFHAQYRVDLYTHTAYSISLSATLLSDQAFVKRIIETTYPTPDRFVPPEFENYIKGHAVFWSFKVPNDIAERTQRNGMYQHIKFEDYMGRLKGRLNDYYEIVFRTLERSYSKNYRPGDKALVFVASVEMATDLSGWLKARYPHRVVNRYCEGEPFEQIQKADICVTTMNSAGTAIDLPNLTTNIMTTAVSSSKANIQCRGRLRVLKDGRTPEFYYFVCTDIPTHMKYHQEKLELLGPTFKAFENVSYGAAVRQ